MVRVTSTGNDETGKSNGVCKGTGNGKGKSTGNGKNLVKVRIRVRVRKGNGTANNRRMKIGGDSACMSEGEGIRVWPSSIQSCSYGLVVV